MALLRSVVTVGGWTMGSRVLGFARDILIAGFVGAGPVADAFFVAFKFPNLFRRLFGEGAFNAAFVPLFARELEGSGLPTARRFAEDAMAALLVVLVPFVFIAQLAMPWLMVVIAPGFVATPETFDLAVDLTRLTFPYLLFMALVALMSGVLNSLDRFAAAAATPILLNVILIAALLVLRDTFSTTGHALAWGVAAAGIAQFLWIAVECRRAGAPLSLPLPRLTPQVRRLLRLMVPGAIGAGVVQINLLIDTILASTLPSGAISYLYYADRVNQLPLGVVGVAVGIALLPLLSRQLRAGRDGDAHDSQNRAIEFTLLLTVPAAAALLVIPQQIVTVLFERGAFAAQASQATAAALAAFALGLPAYVLIKALAPGFFAREDTKTPVTVAAVAMVVNVATALILMQFLAHVGIALATALSAWINAGALGWLLHRRGHLKIDIRLRSRLPRIVGAAGGMALGLWVAAAMLVAPLSGAPPEQFLALAALVAVGLVVFVVLARITGAATVGDVRALLRREA